MQYVIGAIFIFVPLAVFLHERYIISNGIEVDAIVIGMEKRRGHRGQPYYHAVLSYKIDGKDYETTNPTGTTIPIEAVGKSVQIFCHKQNPQKIVVKSRSRILSNIIFIILTVVGIIIITNGIAASA